GRGRTIREALPSIGFGPGLTAARPAFPMSAMTSEQTESRALRALRDLIESGRPLAYVHTAEERRITALCREAAQKYFTPPAPLWIWTLTDGMRRDGAEAPAAHDSKDPLSPRGALEFVVTHDGPGIFLLKDFHE